VGVDETRDLEDHLSKLNQMGWSLKIAVISRQKADCERICMKVTKEEVSAADGTVTPSRACKATKAFHVNIDARLGPVYAS
jgi:hypothetical protein